MATATRTRRQTVYTIFEAVRSDNDLFRDWREIDTHVSSARALPALREWLLENDPPSGEYRAKSTRDGYSVTDIYRGSE